MRVFGYIRVSSSGQVKHGDSLADQRERIKEHCKSNGFTLVRIFEDGGVSGAKVDEDDLVLERPGIQDLLGELQEAEVSRVIVTKTNRLWRSDFAKVLIQRELKKQKADVIAIDQPTYSVYHQDNDPSAFILNGMMELLDQYERLEIVLKLRRGRTRKASKGGYAGGGAPLGYKATRGSKALELDPEKAPTVKRLFELSRKRPKGKKASLQFIADSLNSEGHSTAEGKSFQRVQVKRVLDNREFYKGLYKYGDITSEGTHEALL